MKSESEIHERLAELKERQAEMNNEPSCEGQYRVVKTIRAKIAQLQWILNDE
jgi:ribosomal protein L29